MLKESQTEILFKFPTPIKPSVVVSSYKEEGQTTVEKHKGIL